MADNRLLTAEQAAELTADIDRANAPPLPPRDPTPAELRADADAWDQVAEMATSALDRQLARAKADRRRAKADRLEAGHRHGHWRHQGAAPGHEAVPADGACTACGRPLVWVNDRARRGRYGPAGRPEPGITPWSVVLYAYETQRKMDAGQPVDVYDFPVPVKAELRPNPKPKGPRLVKTDLWSAAEVAAWRQAGRRPYTAPTHPRDAATGLFVEAR